MSTVFSQRYVHEWLFRTAFSDMLLTRGIQQILKNQIRSEIASSSERAYPSLPISSTKSLLFLNSEGEVIQFANHRGWIVKEGHIYFPSTTADGEDGASAKDMSQMIMENTLGYARELETIV